MNLVGFTYDADKHCVDCTRKYIEATGATPGIVHRIISGDIIDFKDSEGNNLHAIFDTDEAGDTPDHCGDCGAYIDTSWHSDTVKYVTDAMHDYITETLRDSMMGGNAKVLDQWAEHHSQCTVYNLDELIRKVYQFIRKEEEE